MSWTVRKEDGSDYGPIELPTLQQWAHEGRLAPEDRVSRDGERWIAAPDLTELAMEWSVLLEDDTPYGPIHLLAFSDLLSDGSVSLDTPIQRRGDSGFYTLGVQLVSALVNQNAVLRERLASLAADATDEDQPADAPDPEAALRRKWQQARRQQDAAVKEADRWKTLYRDEAARSGEREETLREQIRSLKEEHRATLIELERERAASRHLREGAAVWDRVRATADSGVASAAEEIKTELAAALGAYAALSEQMEQLTERLASASRQVESLIDSRTEIQRAADERIVAMETSLRREREEADEARRLYADLERSHTDLLKSYRDIHDRLIQISQRKQGVA
jgi:hypothetical protein